MQGTTGTAPPTIELALAPANQPSRAKSIGKVVLGFSAAVGILVVIGSLAERGSDKGSAPTAEPKKVDWGTQQMRCAPSDFLLKQANWHRENSEFVKIVGELISNCSEPAGVQLQAVFPRQGRKGPNYRRVLAGQHPEYRRTCGLSVFDVDEGWCASRHP